MWLKYADPAAKRIGIDTFLDGFVQDFQFKLKVAKSNQVQTTVVLIDIEELVHGFP